VIENFYSIDPYKSDEIFIQEKINKGPIFISFFIKVHHIKNKCRIERILPSYDISYYRKIMKMLKVGQPVIFYLLLKLPKVNLWKVLYTLQSGCRIIYQAKALGNAKDRLNLTNS
jgi:hypothetical protein